VDRSSHTNRSPLGTVNERQRSSPAKTFAYCCWNISDFTALSIADWISRSVGQISRR
jgi:hypothetical protein